MKRAIPSHSSGSFHRNIKSHIQRRSFQRHRTGKVATGLYCRMQSPGRPPGCRGCHRPVGTTPDSPPWMRKKAPVSRHPHAGSALPAAGPKDHRCLGIEDPHGRDGEHARRRRCSLASLLWIKDNHPEIYKKSTIFGHCNTFMAKWLTGAFAIDPSRPSLTACTTRSRTI